MRIMFLLLLVAFMATIGLSQPPVKKNINKPIPEQVPSKKQMQGQMAGAINELNTQIADLEKQLAKAIENKEDEETIKGYRDQIAMLKKQVEMMGGVSKTMSGISEKTFQQAGEKDPIVPKKDNARINMLPKKAFAKEELALFINRVHAQVESMIPPAEKAEALNMYIDSKSKHNSSDITGNLASSCWMLGHSEKALYIMGRACLDDIDNIDNLNNYAAFLLMSGGEQAALPILEYLNSLYPENSTILNNIGQAWFGLGDMEKAKEKLEEATLLFPNHSMANASLADISSSEGNTQGTISFLKAALKETYDPDKEERLVSLGYNIKFSDLPPLNYPMKNDPFGLIAFMNTLPEETQTNVNDFGPVLNIQSFVKGVRKLYDTLMIEKKKLDDKEHEAEKKMSTNATYRNKILEAHNTPAHKLAKRGLQLRIIETHPVPVTGSIDNDPVEKILASCMKYWNDSVLEPIQNLSYAAQTQVRDCQNEDAITNAYLIKRWEIFSRGVRHIKDAFVRNSYRLTEWIKYHLYGTGIDEPPNNIEDLTFALISEMERTKGKSIIQNYQYRDILSDLEYFYSNGGVSTVFQSKCRDRSVPDPQAANLASMVKSRVECEFKKRVKTSDLYEFELVCNTIVEKTDPKLRPRKPKNPKGAAKSATPRGPISSRLPLLSFGPSANLNDYEMEIIKEKPAPLNAEDKDPSQFSLEYDRWGNLIGFNLQLNKEGNGLADPDSMVSGIDSRWSWNAAGSATKGLLNKLIIK